MSAILCLAILPNNIIVAGLENGTVAAWDLNSNALNPIQANQAGLAITCMHRHENYWIIGDSQGNL